MVINIVVDRATVSLTYRYLKKKDVCMSRLLA